MNRVANIFGDEHDSINYAKLSTELGLHRASLDFMKGKQRSLQMAA